MTYRARKVWFSLDSALSVTGRPPHPQAVTHPFGTTQPMIFGARCPGCDLMVRDRCQSCWSAVPTASELPQAAVAFDSVGRRLVLGFKYGNARSLARPFAERIVAELRRSSAADGIQCVTWAPTAPGRVRRRGYDQAELLAAEVARLLGVPCRRLLRRTGRSAPQTGRTRLDRVAGPAFVGRVPRSVAHVLVIDDVITTGATLEAARRALQRAGARQVTCRAAAATPARSAQARPVNSRARAIAGEKSSSTTMPIMPIDSAAATFEATSSKKALRPGVISKRARVSS